ncbi:Peptidase S8/S53 subtilisin/kexin/sedolisin [Penicillium nucicola]|uniref:Peptidase S8/S53 subtilisin/kexin/sedolisin n=1 Tax=Penicillium nucicola TaxID=1850975 RepID=UPI0025457774|nr:Peptidase S8/S53 subtilisin/kexin/sedolisin [Penicillium nucicola]KAJ5747490.1 Peptidase S8/S53 subtilisin/kexin/sedolisin [Penicillium nucicola]
MASQTSSIVELAEQCFSTLRLCYQLSASIPPREFSLLENQNARFSIWTSNNAVFGPIRASLDHRLREAPEVAEVVKGLLEALNDHLQSYIGVHELHQERHILESNIQAASTNPPNAANIKSLHKLPLISGHLQKVPLSSSGCMTCRRREENCDETKPSCLNCSTGGFVCEGYKIERQGASKVNSPVPTSERLEKYAVAAGKEIELLNKLSNTVRKAGQELSNRKAVDLYIIQDDEGNNVEPFLKTLFAKYIQDKFPGTTEGIVDRLATTALIRRKRILYRRTRYGQNPVKIHKPRPQPIHQAPQGDQAHVSSSHKGNIESSNPSHPKDLAQSIVETAQTSQTKISATTLTPSQFKRISVQSVVSETRTVVLEQHEEIVFPPCPIGNLNKRYKEIQASHNESYKGFLLQLYERLHNLETPRPIETSSAYQTEARNAKERLELTIATDWEQFLRSLPEVICPYCFQALPASEMATVEKWRSHVRKDLDPYVCLFEECEAPEALFSNSNDWLEHMRGHNLRWQCNAKSHGLQRFASRDYYLAHMKETHPRSYTESQLDILADRSARKTKLVFESCPLCGKSDESDDSLVAHIVGHLRLLAVKSLPSYQSKHDVDQPSDTSDPSHGKIISTSEGESASSDRMSITFILGSEERDSSSDLEMNDSNFFADESEFDGISNDHRWQFEWGFILNPAQPDDFAFDPVIQNMLAYCAAPSLESREDDTQAYFLPPAEDGTNEMASPSISPSLRWINCMRRFSTIVHEILVDKTSRSNHMSPGVAILGDNCEWESEDSFLGAKISHKKNFSLHNFETSFEAKVSSNRIKVAQAISLICPNAHFLMAGLSSKYDPSKGMILCTAESVSRALKWIISLGPAIICLPEAIERPVSRNEAKELSDALNEALQAGIFIFCSARTPLLYSSTNLVSANYPECFNIGPIEDFNFPQPMQSFDNIDFLFPGAWDNYPLMGTHPLLTPSASFEPSIATAYATGLAALIITCRTFFRSDPTDMGVFELPQRRLTHQDLKNIFQGIGATTKSDKWMKVWGFFDDVSAECERSSRHLWSTILTEMYKRINAMRLGEDDDMTLYRWDVLDDISSRYNPTRPYLLEPRTSGDEIDTGLLEQQSFLVAREDENRSEGRYYLEPLPQDLDIHHASPTSSTGAIIGDEAVSRDVLSWLSNPEYPFNISREWVPSPSRDLHRSDGIDSLLFLSGTRDDDHEIDERHGNQSTSAKEETDSSSSDSDARTLMGLNKKRRTH